MINGVLRRFPMQRPRRWADGFNWFNRGGVEQPAPTRSNHTEPTNEPVAASSEDDALAWARGAARLKRNRPGCQASHPTPPRLTTPSDTCTGADANSNSNSTSNAGSVSA